jgi:hypothetical protein
MQEAYRKDYEAKAIEAFVQKPAKIAWYSDLRDRATKNGAPKLCWKWSWWALFGGFWFLLYRKAYLAALALFAINLSLAIFIQVTLNGAIVATEYGFTASSWTNVLLIAIGLPLLAAVLVGGFSPYFVIKKYLDQKTKIESAYADEERRLSAIRENGGYNAWAVWIPVIAAILFNLILLAVVYTAVAYPAEFIEGFKQGLEEGLRSSRGF